MNNHSVKSPFLVGKYLSTSTTTMPWFDSVLYSKVDELGDIAAEFYGDNCMEKLLEMLDRMTIRKKSF